jgi:tetratricopeptide (TPR) repeat protein
MPAALLIGLFATAAAAAESPDEQGFRALVAEATLAFGRGDYERAIELANRAYELRADARLLYNVARAKEAMGDADGAIVAYERYLAEAPEAEDRSIVAGRIRALRRQRAMALRLEAERHAQAGRRQRALQAFRQSLRIDPEEPERERVERRIRELEQPAPASASPDSAAPPAERGVVEELGPWVVLGLGTSTLGVGAAFAISADGGYKDASEAANGREAARLRDTADRRVDRANVAFVAGGLLTAAGLTWLVLRPRARASAGVEVRVLPGQLAARCQFY